jgi:D-sedoheptulose 7-phosphate isomerase
MENEGTMPSSKSYAENLGEHIALFNNLQQVQLTVVKAAESIARTLRDGKKVLACGNGGSAADAQHFAAELVGRFETERRALPSIALTTDSSILTAVANDYGHERVFSRQVEGLATPGDLLVGISTSGNSTNVMLAVESAKKMGVKSIGLLGRDGGPLASLVDIPVVVPHSVTARIQEAHIFIIHYWCSVVEQALFPPEK